MSAVRSAVLARPSLFSGTHERGTSHYELLRAFVSSTTLEKMAHQLDLQDYRTHEFGDSILVERESDTELRTLPRAAALRRDSALV
jgi:hypothetical protein